MRHGLHSLAWVLSCLLVAGAALAAEEYREAFDETRPPQEMFQGRLLVGEADGWTGEVKKGTYFLINRETPEAEKIIVLPKPVPGAAKIAVSIIGQFEGQKAGAGLAYGYQPDGGYYAFVVMANSGYALYRGGADGLRQLSKATNKAIQGRVREPPLGRTQRLPGRPLGQRRARLWALGRGRRVLARTGRDHRHRPWRLQLRRLLACARR